MRIPIALLVALLCLNTARATPILTVTYSQNNWAYDFYLISGGLPVDAQSVGYYIDSTFLGGGPGINAVGGGWYFPANSTGTIYAPGSHTTHMEIQTASGTTEVYGSDIVWVTPTGPRPDVDREIPVPDATPYIHYALLLPLLFVRRSWIRNPSNASSSNA